MALSTSTWIVMFGAIIVLWGTAVWALVRSLRDEDEKLELLDEQGEIDTYSPRSLTELREWIRANPGDKHADEARDRYNECVETLRRIDTTFYDWDRSEIDSLEKL
ncbi:hypothetical protein [Haladaptatus sp.]|uniref:hypothetical protein n=1 Tax=Haladaptatus sp. TaxID=1973141 RepID=UPI003C67082B